MTVAAAPSPAKSRKAPKPVSLAPAGRPVQIAVAATTAAVLALAIASRPHLDMLFAASPVIQIHVYAAVAALLLGAAILVLRKGRTFHKYAGWTWVALMGAVAIVSLFITSSHPGHWSLIHILSGWTLFALPLGIYFIKRRKLAQHRKMMTGIYLGGLIIAGGFTFLPGRLMYAIFFS